MGIVITTGGETVTLPLERSVLSSNFESAVISDPIREQDMWAAIGGQVGNSTLFTKIRVSTSTGEGKVLKQKFPGGTFGIPPGIGMWAPLPNGPLLEATLTVRFRFMSSTAALPFGWGGKMFGLAGVSPGRGTPPSGMKPSIYGFSERFMWLSKAAGFSSENPKPNEIIGYKYWPDQPVDTYGVNVRTGFVPIAGQFHTASLTVRMNSISASGVVSANGYRRLTMDGVVGHESNTNVFRRFADTKITHLAVDMFRGGGDAAWSVPQDCDLDIALIEITTPS